MKVKTRDIKEFYLSLNKITKAFLLAGTPLIIALFAGGIFLEFYMFKYGYHSETARLARELIQCSSDCFSAVYIPAFIIELFKGDYNTKFQ